MIKKSEVGSQRSGVGMQTVLYPDKSTWNDLCQRPVQDFKELEQPVKKILDRVKNEGDKALFELTDKFDGTQLETLNLNLSTINYQLSTTLREAILLAKQNIEKFHKSQMIEEPLVETMPGVQCWRKNIPIEKVGLYIPGGSAPLFSTMLMLGVPAKLAGCKEIIVCTPPDKEGNVDPAIIFTAQLIGIDKICTIGGAQAIAALAYGNGNHSQSG